MSRVERGLPGPSVGAKSSLWTVAAALAATAGVAVAVRTIGAPFVLAGSLLLGGAAGLLILPQAATILTVFLLYINFPAVLTKQLGMPTLVAGAFIGLLGSPLLWIVVAQRKRLTADVTLTQMVVFLAVMLLSTLQAIDATLALERIATYASEGILLYFLLVNVIRDVVTLRRVIWAAVVAGSLLSVLCIYQDATGRYDQEFGGLAYRNYVTVQDAAIGGPTVQPGWDRAQGPVDEPNRFAQLLIVLLPLAVYLHRTAATTRARLVVAGTGALVLTGIVLTLSRGAFLTVAIMLTVLILLGWVRGRMLAVFAGLLLVASPVLAPRAMDRLQSIGNARYVLGGDASSAQEADGAIRGRITEMRAALYAFKDHPILGVGPAQFPPFYFPLYSRDSDIKFIEGPRRAHDLYLEMAAELGIVGLAAFLTIVSWVMRRLWRTRRYWYARKPAYSDLATALWLALGTYLFTALFLHLSYQRYYWFLVALAGAALHLLGSGADAAQATPAVAQGPPVALSHSGLRRAG